MKIIEKDSRFTIQCHFTLSQTDDAVLSLLYVPIIGGTAYALYRYLLSMAVFVPRKEAFYFPELEESLAFKTADILEGFSRLEAIGLLSTYRREKLEGAKRDVLYLFRLFPPASPKKFFADVILKNLLWEQVGTKGVQELSFLFLDREESLDGFVDLSSRLGDVFTLSGESGNPETPEIEDKTYKSVSTFDRKRFLSLLKEARLDKACRKEMDALVDMLTLYGLGEEEAVDLVEKNVDSEGLFHFDGFRKDIRDFQQYRPVKREEKDGNYESRLLSLFGKLTPKEYLSYRLNANPPVYMLDEIEKIAGETKLGNPILNVILDYSLKKTDGKFAPLYVEKVAYSLLGQNVHSAYEAMVYLNSQDVQKRAALNKKRKASKTPTKKKDDWDDILEEMDGNKEERKVQI